MSAQGYVITVCKSQKSADQTRKWYQKRGVPANVRRVNDNRFLIVTSRNFVDAVHHARIAR